jgi:HAMP domain-containing protein
VPGRRLNHPIFQRFSFKILLLGIVAGIIPLVSILLIFGLFSHSLLNDLHQSLADLKAWEGQRLKNHQQKLIHQQVRQKALDVAQDIASYLKNHPGKTWEQIFRDPVFREVAVQPVGTVGETFLVMALQKRILLHSEKSYEGQTLEEVLCAPGKAAAADLHFAGTPGLQEFFLAQGRGLDIFCHGFLVPILLPLKGPELMVGAWVDPREMDLIAAQSRAIFKTALNVTRALVETRLSQFRQHLFYVLATLSFLVLMAGMALARRITSQVTALTRAAEAFDQGNLSHRIIKPGQDELGQLARTLNRMAASLNDNTISRMEWENNFNVLPDPPAGCGNSERIFPETS